jgi:hypothetical protein
MMLKARAPFFFIAWNVHRLEHSWEIDPHRDMPSLPNWLPPRPNPLRGEISLFRG